MARADFPEPVRHLIASLKSLPGIGPRSAERMAIWLLQHPAADPAGLAHALTHACETVAPCEICGFFSTSDGCVLCGDQKRDAGVLCIVEQATDVLPVERSGAFRGYYHCLGGKLSPLDRVSPEDLRIPQLLRRIEGIANLEIILALGSDVEGEATANYLADLLAPRGHQLSRLAQGLPAGGGLGHADELTLLRAIQGRRKIGE